MEWGVKISCGGSGDKDEPLQGRVGMEMKFVGMGTDGCNLCRCASRAQAEFLDDRLLDKIYG